MRTGGAAATRQNLLKARRRIERVERGVELLRRKREALVQAFFQAARPAAEVRAAVEAGAARAYEQLLEALAARGRADLLATARPARELTLALRELEVWGVPSCEVVERPPARRTLEARGTAPQATGPATAAAASAFEDLVDLLLGCASQELRLRRLGAALRRTCQQVGLLEHRIGPSIRGEIQRIARTLDEREREERVRLGFLRM